MLEIKNLHVKVTGKEILKGIDLSIGPGEVHAVMGPNGSGKTTLAQVLAGRLTYEVTGGTARFEGKDLLAMKPEDRAREGVFMAFQYPVEIPGVSNAYFLKAALNAIRKYRGLEEIDAMDFMSLVQDKAKLLGLDETFMKRGLNEGFSGGEKKKNEVFQMAVLEPKFCILDETDSGLDIDALRLVANGVNTMRSPKRSMLVVTHYQRLLDYVIPEFVHVLVDGRIVKSGDADLARNLGAPSNPAILGGPDGVVAEKLEPFAFGILKTTRLVFVNGRYAPRLSYLRPLPEGVRIASLAEVLRQDPGSLENDLTRFARFQEDSFVALNTAFFIDGAYVDVPKNAVVDEPIHLVFVSTSRDRPTVAYPRNLIRLGAGSLATVIETYAWWAPAVTFTNAVTEIVAGPASVLEHYKIQRESEAAFHIATMAVDQDRNSSVSCHSMSFGGALVRNYVHTIFRAEGGSVALNGLFMPSGAQQSDHYTRIDQAAPACTSLELYRGILSRQ